MTEYDYLFIVIVILLIKTSIELLVKSLAIVWAAISFLFYTTISLETKLRKDIERSLK